MQEAVAEATARLQEMIAEGQSGEAKQAGWRVKQQHWPDVGASTASSGAVLNPKA